jgi:hypothetical protein
MAVVPAGEALLEASRTDDLRRLLMTIRPRIEAFGTPPALAGLAILDARLAIHGGDIDAARRFLDRAIQLSEGCGNAIISRRARELRLQLLNQDQDRLALRALHARIAAALPEDLREIFMASPRVAPLLKT